MKTAPVKDFQLTWVVYNPNDPFGAPLAFCSLAPVFISVMYATLMGFQRDLNIIMMVVGQVLNEVVNQVLKRLIRQERPHGARRGGSGMPSAHSQFTSFFASYVVMYTWKSLNPVRQLEQTLTIVGAIILAFLVCTSRVRLGYHTRPQVVAGFFVGSITGALWEALISHLSPWLFPMITQTRLAQFLFIRDVSHIPDLIVYQHKLSGLPAMLMQGR